MLDAIPQARRHHYDFKHFDENLRAERPEDVEGWAAMEKKWQSDYTARNPYLSSMSSTLNGSATCLYAHDLM